MSRQADSYTEQGVQNGTARSRGVSTVRRFARGLLIGLGVVVGALSLGLVGWHVLDDTPSVAQAVPATTTFGASRLLVLADADMAATAYADGVLHPIEGSNDQLIILSNLGAEEPTRTTVPVPNTVMGWPGATTVSPDGRFAYIVESRTALDRSVIRVENVWEGFPVGRTLTAVDLETGEIISELDVCQEPLSVDVAPSGGWLLVACRDRSELVVVTISGGRPNEVHAFDLEVSSTSLRPDVAPGATYAVVHPSGRAAGVVLDDHAVTLVRFERDADGVPIAAEAEEPQTMPDRWLSVARWTRSGDHLLVADVAWGPAPTDSVFNGAGSILSFALSPNAPARGLVSEAMVSKSPEAFEMNRDGTLLAVVNMERTYLPSGFVGAAPVGLFPGRGASSLSLVGVDDATGMLTPHGEPVGFRGVLPEDVVFDRDGDQLAVVIYQDHNAPRSGGWVQFFDVDTTGPEPRVRLTDRRIDLPRGVHDLHVID